MRHIDHKERQSGSHVSMTLANILEQKATASFAERIDINPVQGMLDHAKIMITLSSVKDDVHLGRLCGIINKQLRVFAASLPTPQAASVESRQASPKMDTVTHNKPSGKKVPASVPMATRERPQGEVSQAEPSVGLSAGIKTCEASIYDQVSALSEVARQFIEQLTDLYMNSEGVPFNPNSTDHNEFCTFKTADQTIKKLENYLRDVFGICDFRSFTNQKIFNQVAKTTLKYINQWLFFAIDLCYEVFSHSQFDVIASKHEYLLKLIKMYGKLIHMISLLSERLKGFDDCFNAMLNGQDNRVFYTNSCLLIQFLMNNFVGKCMEKKLLESMYLALDSIQSNIKKVDSLAYYEKKSFLSNWQILFIETQAKNFTIDNNKSGVSKLNEHFTKCLLSIEMIQAMEGLPIEVRKKVLIDSYNRLMIILIEILEHEYTKKSSDFYERFCNSITQLFIEMNKEEVQSNFLVLGIIELCILDINKNILWTHHLFGRIMMAILSCTDSDPIIADAMLSSIGLAEAVAVITDQSQHCEMARYYLEKIVSDQVPSFAYPQSISGCITYLSMFTSSFIRSGQDSLQCYQDSFYLVLQVLSKVKDFFDCKYMELNLNSLTFMNSYALILVRYSPSMKRLRWRQHAVTSDFQRFIISVSSYFKQSFDDADYSCLSLSLQVVSIVLMYNLLVTKQRPFVRTQDGKMSIDHVIVLLENLKILREVFFTGEDYKLGYSKEYLVYNALFNFILTEIFGVLDDFMVDRHRANYEKVKTALKDLPGQDKIIYAEFTNNLKKLLVISNLLKIPKNKESNPAGSSEGRSTDMQGLLFTPVEGVKFPIGAGVKIDNLVRKPMYNGKLGCIASRNNQSGRYGVKLKCGTVLSIQPSNLSLDTDCHTSHALTGRR